MKLERFKEFLRMYGDLYGRHKFKLAAILSLSFLNGLAGSLGVVVLVPLFGLLVNDRVAEENPVSGAIASVFGYFGWELTIASLLVLIFSIFLLKAAVLYFFMILNKSISLMIEIDLSKKLYRNMFFTSWSHLSKQKIGYLEFSLTTDLATTTKILNNFSHLLLHLVSFLMYLATALYLSFFVTLSAAVLGFLVLICSQPIMRKIKNYSAQSSRIRRGISHFVNESVIGLKTIKSFGVESKMADKLEEYLVRYKKIVLNHVKLFALISQPVEPLGYIFITIVFALAYSRPDFSLASFAVTVYLLHQLFLFTEKFQSSYHGIAQSLPYAERIMALKKNTEIYQEKNGGKDPFVFQGVLEFKNIHFSYEAREATLSGLDFKIPKGVTAAIIGPSGAGKTTIVDLLMRLLRPDKGEILIDGESVEKFNLADWRRSIGYVSQDIFLKNDTIENNIKFFDEAISDNDMVESAKAANIHDFVESLPQKYKSVVGERGVFLSAGQRQRIALARVLARKPEILILDEATSSLDNESEALIKKSIDELRGKITIIVIAHRLSTISDADKVVALLDGRVVESGTPEELLNKPDSYFSKVYSLT